MLFPIIPPVVAESLCVACRSGIFEGTARGVDEKEVIRSSDQDAAPFNANFSVADVR